VAGELLFAAYAWLNRGGGEAPRVVRITAKEEARVAAKVGLIDPDQRW